jgi:hypothetical protein
MWVSLVHMQKLRSWIADELNYRLWQKGTTANCFISVSTGWSNKNAPDMSIGARFGNGVGYSEPCPQEHNRDISISSP